MKSYFFAGLLACSGGLALGQEAPRDAVGPRVKSELIELDLGRTEGFFSKSPVSIRAIALSSPAKPAADTALLFFRGWPGVAELKDAGDWRLRGNLNFLLKAVNHVLDQDLMLVVMDCPSDQWGLSGRNPTRCNDDYRESSQHADDVRRVMAQLRGKHGIRQFFIMGHSYGTISSRWLAINLGDEIAGSIHSASMTGRTGRPSHQYATSVVRMNLSKAKAPHVFLHHEEDQCAATGYEVIKSWAGSKLMSIQGGGTSGDVCGGKHHHSYEDREMEAAQAVVGWIKANGK